MSKETIEETKETFLKYIEQLDSEINNYFENLQH